MTFIEFLGFIISMAAMIFLFVKRGLDERKRRQNPEAYEEELEKQDGKLRDFLKSLEMDMEQIDQIAPPPMPKKKVLPPPPPKIKPVAPLGYPKIPKRAVEGDYDLQARLEHHKPKSDSEQRKIKPSYEDYKAQDAQRVASQGLGERAELSYNVERQKNRPKSRGVQVLSSLKSKKDWMIIQEVLGQPIALRKSINGHW
jgi:hypothetical protein